MILGTLTSHFTDVEIGGIYRRRGPGAMIETAHVIEIVPDKMGIPHVRFELMAARGVSTPFIETRTLGLEAFLSKFKEKIQN